MHLLSEISSMPVKVCVSVMANLLVSSAHLEWRPPASELPFPALPMHGRLSECFTLTGGVLVDPPGATLTIEGYSIKNGEVLVEVDAPSLASPEIYDHVVGLFVNDRLVSIVFHVMSGRVRLGARFVGKAESFRVADFRSAGQAKYEFLSSMCVKVTSRSD